MIRVIVFSKDRPFQVESLVRSLRELATGVDEIVVVAVASTSAAREGYLVMRQETGCKLVFEAQPGASTRELQALFEGADFVGFTVDDQLFFRPSDYRLAARALVEDDAFLWSWRLSAKLTVTDDRGLWWRCSSGEGSYGYLFHTDGSLYETKALVAFFDRALPAWRVGRYTPNDLEGRTVRYARGLHVGPFEKTCVSFALNKVTTAVGATALWCAVAETTPEALIEAFLAGRRFDNAAFYLRAAEWSAGTHVPATQEAARFYASLIRG